MNRQYRQIILKISAVLCLIGLLWILLSRIEIFGSQARKVVSTIPTVASAIKLNELNSLEQFVRIEPPECMQMKPFAEGWFAPKC